jgi:hypothetical protein
MFIVPVLLAVCVPAQIDLEVVPPRAMSPVVVHAIVQEAGQIWLPQGIVVREGRGPSALSVLIDDRAPAVSSWVHPLGATPFSDSGAPGRVISLFYAAAIDLIANARLPNEAGWRWVVPYQREVVERVLGRALAHEIGHYLLRSRAHSLTGLMRAQLSIAELMAEDRRRFELTPSEARSLSRATSAPAAPAATAAASGGAPADAAAASGSCQ